MEDYSEFQYSDPEFYDWILKIRTYWFMEDPQNWESKSNEAINREVSRRNQINQMPELTVTAKNLSNKNSGQNAWSSELSLEDQKILSTPDKAKAIYNANDAKKWNVFRDALKSANRVSAIMAPSMLAPAMGIMSSIGGIGNAINAADKVKNLYDISHGFKEMSENNNFSFKNMASTFAPFIKGKIGKAINVANDISQTFSTMKFGGKLNYLNYVK